jgi:hypothetical protein
MVQDGLKLIIFLRAGITGVIFYIIKKVKGWGVVQVVQHLTGMLKSQ